MLLTEKFVLHFPLNNKINTTKMTAEKKAQLGSIQSRHIYL